MRDCLLGLASTASVMVPLPVPLAPLEIVIHGTPLVTVRSQVAEFAWTVTLTVPPVPATFGMFGVNVHGADWLTVNMEEPTVTVAVLEPEVLAVAVQVIVLSPVPDDGAIVSQDAEERADHAHAVDKSNDPEPPVAITDALPGF